MEVLIEIVNEQDKINFTSEYEKIAEDVIKAALKYEGVKEDCYVFVTLTDNENIREINNEQRGIDSATDVLSFPVLEFENGQMLAGVGDYYEDKLILGDVVLSLERTEEQRIEFNHSFEREMGYLICHSMLHLLGYDHETDDERAVMRTKEEEILETIGLTR